LVALKSIYDLAPEERYIEYWQLCADCWASLFWQP